MTCLRQSNRCLPIRLSQPMKRKIQKVSNHHLFLDIIINHDSKFVQTLDTIYKSEENEKFEKIVAEIKIYIKSIRQRKPKYLKNKQMRVITDETEKYIYDDTIAEVSSDSDSIS